MSATTPSIPTPAPHADTVVATIKDAFPFAEIQRSDNPDRWNRNNVFSAIHVTIEVASGLENNSETRKLTVHFSLNPREKSCEVRGTARAVTLKLVDDHAAFGKKIVAKMRDHIDAERTELRAMISRRIAEAAKLQKTDELRREFPRAYGVLGYRLRANSVELEPYLGTGSDSVGCEPRELMRVALAAIEAHLENKAAEARRNARTVEQNLAWAERLGLDTDET